MDYMFKIINKKFTKFNLTVIEIQANDRKVGIFQGWVTYEDEGGVYEINYDYALNLKTKEGIKTNSLCLD